VTKPILIPIEGLEKATRGGEWPISQIEPDASLF
jgi:hypothetical protein